MIILYLIFRSTIHFKLIFVYGVRQGSSFILLHVDTQCSRHQFVEKMIHSPLKGLGTLAENELALSVKTHVGPGLSETAPRCLKRCGFDLSPEMGKCWVLQFCSFVPRLFQLLWVPDISLWISGSDCQFLERQQLGFWYGLCRIYRSIWGAPLLPWHRAVLTLFSDSIVNGIVFLILFFESSLLVYKHIICFIRSCILSLKLICWF